ncbi:methyl-accepting chemotaxis protein [Tenuifilum thalassicum]|uniref:Methyl-accepting chemotaxis protein n=1 Tax=Tenuifilum thalassicum TaxID=2590900 RepID=A0A7D4CQS0_9BACT|nr:methyl-accepting chemotaxis protein [Tenuifilum thalassicum]QKG79645.1 methyl-accepting chemotaxis protein [Tenuifilum thalassicum]
MEHLYIIIGLVVVLVPISIGIFKLIFKNSIVFTISAIALIFIGLTAIAGYSISIIDMINLSWIIPLFVAALWVGLSYFKRIIGNSLKIIAESQEAISKGNLETEIPKELLERKDEFGYIARSTNDTVIKLKEVIENIVFSSNSILSASHQLSKSSEELSQGANEQASNAEQVGSLVEEMSANIQQNTENAKHAEKISLTVAKEVKNLSAVSDESLDAIKKIAEKINIINDIAFQTNILALNAAVEAARAGESGRGFAVVAAEVRKLAERSKAAADEIILLSEKSVNVTEEASKQMQILQPEIEKTIQLVNEIAAANIEQSAGMEQINNATQQLNQVIQQNAASSEELASSAEELTGQAEQLKEVASYFLFNKDFASVSTKAQNNSKTGKKSSEEDYSLKPAPKAKQNNTSKLGYDIKLSKTNDSDYESF